MNGLGCKHHLITTTVSHSHPSVYRQQFHRSVTQQDISSPMSYQNGYLFATCRDLFLSGAHLWNLRSLPVTGSHLKSLPLTPILSFLNHTSHSRVPARRAVLKGGIAQKWVCRGVDFCGRLGVSGNRVFLHPPPLRHYGSVDIDSFIFLFNSPICISRMKRNTILFSIIWHLECVFCHWGYWIILRFLINFSKRTPFLFCLTSVFSLPISSEAPSCWEWECGCWWTPQGSGKS